MKLFLLLTGNTRQTKHNAQEVRSNMHCNLTGALMIVFSLLAFSCTHTSNEEAAHNHEAAGNTDTGKADSHDDGVISLTKEQMATVGIELGKVEEKELTATIKANGLLKVPNNSKANVTSLYGGVVNTLHVELGDNIRKGQVVATIANPQFIQLQEEFITLASKIIFAEQEVLRQKELNAGNAGALKNLQNATAELNALRARKASLHEQMQLMGINPSSINNNNLRSELVVTSPLSGTVSKVIAKIGSYVDVSAPVAEIVDNSSLHLDLQVFEKDLPLLKTGQVIHFTITNNPVSEYDAKIFSIGSSFENESKTIAVHCDVTGNKKGLIDGMNVTAIVSLNDIKSPAVPDGAIVNSDGKDFIFVVNDKLKDSASDVKHSATTFEKIEIVKGVSNMGYTAVNFISPISAAAKIVTKGAFFVNAKMTNTGDHEH